MSIDRSKLYPFRLADDPGNLYILVDLSILEEAKEGKAAAVREIIDGYRWTPSQDQLDNGQISVWAGNDPPSIYFRAPEAALKTALEKRWVDDGADGDIPVISAVGVEQVMAVDASAGTIPH